LGILTTPSQETALHTAASNVQGALRSHVGSSARKKVSVAKKTYKMAACLPPFGLQTFSLWRNPVSFSLKLWAVEEVKV